MLRQEKKEHVNIANGLWRALTSEPLPAGDIIENLFSVVNKIPPAESIFSRQPLIDFFSSRFGNTEQNMDILVRVLRFFEPWISVTNTAEEFKRVHSERDLVTWGRFEYVVFARHFLETYVIPNLHLERPNHKDFASRLWTALTRKTHVPRHLMKELTDVVSKIRDDKSIFITLSLMDFFSTLPSSNRLENDPQRTTSDKVCGVGGWFCEKCKINGFTEEDQCNARDNGFYVMPCECRCLFRDVDCRCWKDGGAMERIYEKNDIETDENPQN